VTVTSRVPVVWLPMIHSVDGVPCKQGWLNKLLVFVSTTEESVSTETGSDYGTLFDCEL